MYFSAIIFPLEISFMTKTFMEIFGKRPELLGERGNKKGKIFS